MNRLPIIFCLSLLPASGGANDGQFDIGYASGFRAGLERGIAQGEQLCFTLAVPQERDRHCPIKIIVPLKDLSLCPSP